MLYHLVSEYLHVLVDARRILLIFYLTFKDVTLLAGMYVAATQGFLAALSAISIIVITILCIYVNGCLIFVIHFYLKRR